MFDSEIICQGALGPSRLCGSHKFLPALFCLSSILISFSIFKFWFETEDASWDEDQALEWLDFQVVRKTEQILSRGHWLHTGMWGVHFNCAFLPSPISQNQISLFPLVDSPKNVE